MTFLLAPGQIPSAENFGEYDVYTPALTAATTNPTLGTGATQDGIWYRTGLWVAGSALIVVGTGPTAGSGAYSISLPLALDTAYIASGSGQGHIIGSGYIRDTSAGTNSRIVALMPSTVSTSTVFLHYNGASTVVTEAAPFAPAAGDTYSITFGYMADPAQF